jgi:hypothetical protein
MELFILFIIYFTRIEYYNMTLVRVFLTIEAAFSFRKGSANPKDERYLFLGWAVDTMFNVYFICHYMCHESYKSLEKKSYNTILSLMYQA